MGDFRNIGTDCSGGRRLGPHLNVIALCAGHHREAHCGGHRIKPEQEFMAILKGKIGT